MNILVTGGAGFIGSHLCQKLIDDGNKVYCLDNFFTGKKKNVRNLSKNKKFILIRHNIIKPINIKDKIDQIYNLACPASPVHYQKYPALTTKTSIYGIFNVLDFARENKATVLQASTSEIYGDPEIHPQKEDYHGNVNCLGPRACYDEGKRCAETICMDYNRKFNTDIKIIRIFNTYGPNMSHDDGRVVSNFIIQALKNKPITIYGEGNHTRSFQYIDDLINGMIKMMNKNNFTGPVNIGNPNEKTIKELAEKIIQLTNSKSKIKYKRSPKDDPKKRKPDISLAKKKLNWTPKIKLEKGLIKTIEYFKKNSV